MQVRFHILDSNITLKLNIDKAKDKHKSKFRINIYDTNLPNLYRLVKHLYTST